MVTLVIPPRSVTGYAVPTQNYVGEGTLNYLWNPDGTIPALSETFDIGKLVQGPPYGSGNAVFHNFLSGFVSPSEAELTDNEGHYSFKTGKRRLMTGGSVTADRIDSRGPRPGYYTYHDYGYYVAQGQFVSGCYARQQWTVNSTGKVIWRSSVEINAATTYAMVRPSGYMSYQTRLGYIQTAVDLGDDVSDPAAVQAVAEAYALRSLALAIAKGSYSPSGYYAREQHSPRQSDIDVGDVYARLMWRLDYESQRALPIPDTVERDLSKQCVEGQQMYDGNVSLLLSKVSSIGSSIDAAARLIGDLRNPKAYSSAWLAGRFGDRLAYNGWSKLISQIHKELGSLGTPGNGERTSRGSSSFSSSLPDGTDVNGECHARLVCHKGSYNAAMTAIKKLYDWDAWITLQNAYDAIPLSFVVDWFLHCSTILDNIDKMVYSMYLDVKLYERSDKLTYHLNISGSGDLTFNLDYTRYHRYQSALRTIGFLDDWEVTLPRAISWADGTALIVQFAP